VTAMQTSGGQRTEEPTIWKSMSSTGCTIAESTARKRTKVIAFVLYIASICTIGKHETPSSSLVQDA